MNALSIYLRYIGVSIRSQMQYRASFICYTLGNFVATSIEFVGIWALFARFGGFKGWTLAEVALFYGMMDVAFAIAEAVPRGFDVLPRLIKAGDLDRFLVRPRTVALQVLGHEFQLMRLGRLSQGLAILIWGAAAVGIAWTPAKVAMLVAGILGGACVFSGLFIIGATISFWTIESLELVNITTYGGVYTAQYPLSIYRPWMRWMLMTIVPLAVCNYLPAHAILGRADVWGMPVAVQVVSPVVGLVFLLLSLGFWRFGVKRYQSTGN